MPRIIIYDESDEFAIALADGLFARGHEVWQTNALGEAWRWATSGDFDLVIVNLDIGGLGGSRILELIKSQRVLPAIITVTEHPDPGLEVRAGLAGVAGFFVKPVTIDRLCSAADEALRSET